MVSDSTTVAEGWREPLSIVDPHVDRLLGIERQRQRAGLHLLAPSMLVSPAIRECLASDLGSLDGEGYASRSFADFDDFLVAYGEAGASKFNPSGPAAEYLENLAQERLAEVFSRGTGLSPRSLSVNVHPASGSIANLAILYGLLEPGATVLSLSTAAGGHISHGAAFHRSGKDFNFVHVGLARDDNSLDYARLEEAFRANKPAAVLVGASSFPRQIEWNLLRGMIDADSASDCFLIADIAHFAGLVTAGAYTNPLPAADVVSLVGYKTFGGPKSAVIICRDPEPAKRISRSLFPGIQGAPRMTEIAAMAVAACTSGTPMFQLTIERAVRLATQCGESLRELGVPLAFKGTDTHMLLVDLGPDANRVVMDLESVGIFANANLLPGDSGPSRSTGLRIGTVGAAQRGLGPEHASELASLLYGVIGHIRRDGGRESARELVSDFVGTHLV